MCQCEYTLTSTQTLLIVHTDGVGVHSTTAVCEDGHLYIWTYPDEQLYYAGDVNKREYIEGDRDGPHEYLRCVAFLSLEPLTFAMGNKDSVVLIWSQESRGGPATVRELFPQPVELPSASSGAVGVEGVDSRIRNVEVSPDKRWLAAASWIQAVRVYDLSQDEMPETTLVGGHSSVSCQCCSNPLSCLFNVQRLASSHNHTNRPI